MAASTVTANAPPDFTLSTLVINDGDAPIKAQDIRSLHERCLTNDAWLQKSMLTHYAMSQNAVVGTGWAWGAPYLFTQATSWVNSVLSQAVANVETDDDLFLEAFGNWQFNAASTTNMIAKLRLVVVEDNGGASTVRVIPGTVCIVDNSPGPGLPRNQPYSLGGVHRVITAGPALVRVQGIVYDLTGGAGTGSAFMMFDNQLNVTHHNRQP